MTDRLISANYVKTRLEEHKALFIDAWLNKEMPYGDRCRVDEIGMSIAEITNAPTVYENKTGSWEYVELTENLLGGGALTKRGYKCSNCGFFRHRKRGISNYCEECGCQMEVENEGNS